MKGLCASALLVLLAACHFDKLFSGGGSERPLSHGTPTGLVFTTRPTNVHAGEALPAIRVAVVDSAGVPVAGADSLITIELGNPRGAKLSGMANKPAVNGVAVFDDLRVDTPADGYTLTASGGGLGPTESDSFDVMPGPATTGSLAVTTTTSGASPDLDGYTVTVDGGGGASRHIDPNDTISFDNLAPGSHGVVLSDIAGNCTVNGGPSKTVNITAGALSPASFSVDCPTPPPPPNQQPIVSAGGHQDEVTGILVSLQGASFSDPDHNGPWIVTIDWDDGDVSQFTMTSEGTIDATHTYVVVLPRDFHVTVTVEDAQGARGSATKTISVALL